MDADAFRKAGHRAIEEVAAYYEKLQKGSSEDGFQVAPSIQPGDILRQIAKAPPEQPEDFATVQNSFNDIILPGTCHWQHPSFFAYFPSNSTFESIIADIYATATSTPGFNHSCNPAATEVEQAMTDWVGQMLGLDAETFCKNGVIQTTASEAALVAAVAARERAIRMTLARPAFRGKSRGDILPQLVMYGSTQTHSLGAKAGLILGLPFRSIETYAEDNWALTGASVKAAFEADSAKGYIPFMIIATVGTTSSGAVDNISEVCDTVKLFPSVFVHVDAAWAGVYLAIPELRKQLQLDAINKRGEIDGEDSIGEVHSFCTNTHKSGLVAFDASCFFMRDSRLLTEVLDVTPPFLRNHAHQGAVTDYRNWGLALGRRFRSLKLLFVLRSYGVSGFQAHLQRSINLAQDFEARVKADDRFELVTPRSLALVVFRLAPASLSGKTEQLDNLNKALYANLHKNKSLQLTSTIIGGIFCVRMAIGGHSTQSKHILQAWESISRSADEVLEQRH